MIFVESQQYGQGRSLCAFCAWNAMKAFATISLICYVSASMALNQMSPAALAARRATPLATYVTRLLRRAVHPEGRPYRSQREFTGIVNVDPSQLSRVLSGEPGITFNPLQCARIARHTDGSIYKLLRLAGHGELAQLLFELCGVPASREDVAVLTAFRRLSPQMADEILSMLKNLSRPDTPTRSGVTRRRKVAV
jgi:hypothetical protein